MTAHLLIVSTTILLQNLLLRPPLVKCQRLETRPRKCQTKKWDCKAATDLTKQLMSKATKTCLLLLTVTKTVLYLFCNTRRSIYFPNYTKGVLCWRKDMENGFLSWWKRSAWDWVYFLITFQISFLSTPPYTISRQFLACTQLYHNPYLPI